MSQAEFRYGLWQPDRQPVVPGSYTEFNPFNHGTTTINYKDVPSSVIDNLSVVLKNGWGITASQNIQQVGEAEINGNNFVFSSGQEAYVLKASYLISPEMQELFNRCILYCEAQEAPVPHIIPTNKGENCHMGTDFSNTSIIRAFTLSSFIDGEHFDGSQEEVAEIARGLAQFHKAFERIPYRDEIARKKGTLVVHDWKILDLLPHIAQARPEEADFVVNDYLPEVLEWSQIVREADIQSLPMQIIHNDVHPHNTLFDKQTKELRALYDLDFMAYSQRARDVAFGMHRFARTYGTQTEKKQDIGIDIRDRAKLFITEYHAVNPLTEEEIKALPYLIVDQALHKLVMIIGDYYTRRDGKWLSDLTKQLTTINESSLFVF